MSEGEVQYARGGYVKPGWSRVAIDPDECVFRIEDIRAERWVCSRPGHPTATSDCLTGSGRTG